MRADTVGRDLTGVHQAFAFETVHAKYAAPGVGGVVLGGIQPFAAFVHDGVAIEVPVRLRGYCLQQAPVTQVDQVAFGAWAPGDEQGDGQLGVVDDGMATLSDLGAEHLCAVQAKTYGKVLAVAVVTRREQQGFAAFVAEQAPAAQGEGTEQYATEFECLASQHDQSPSLALKPSWMFSALARSPSCRRWTTFKLS